ncbi:MAG: hypothetical protein IPJ69_09910 [Deltaproteobacteria bacterium]|nr:MAG: hypothetical protein IPJ69_09910 [Deltaproteobacteria bacterium]
MERSSLVDGSLREGIGLRGYGQKDPLLEYKREGFQIFENMLREFRDDVLTKLFRVQIEENPKWNKSIRHENSHANEL